MKLATKQSDSRDGELLVVSRDLKRAISAKDLTPNLQTALEHWDELYPMLNQRYQRLNDSSDTHDAFDLNLNDLLAPLPRAYQFLDASAYLNHVELARKARGEAMPPEISSNPLMYQGLSHQLNPWNQAINPSFIEHGLDFEAEIAIMTDDTPTNLNPEDAAEHIKLIMLINDISLRELIPAEFKKGFGFIQSKPPCACSPIAVTPDELGEAWKNGKLDLELNSIYNQQPFGHPNASHDMAFSFFELLSHASQTRSLCAGTILGSGTVSNKDRSTGSSCLAEKRMLQKIDDEPLQDFMKLNDQIKIEMFNQHRESIFGAIEQKVTHEEL